MILGDCPHCGAFMMNHFFRPGVVTKHECDECGESVWIRHSRIDPEAYSEKPEGLVRIDVTGEDGCKATTETIQPKPLD